MLALISANIAQFEKIVTFLITLSILVVLHEYGHFLLARRNGVRVNEFAVGFGPKLFSWTSPRSGTVYAINLLPIGGYCAMKGEDGKSNEGEQQREFRAQREYDPDNFQGKTAWQRLAIIVAGPFANFILAFAILLFAAVIIGVPDVNTAQPIVGPIVAGFPADKVGIQTGDLITAIDGKAVNGQELLDTIHGSLGRNLAITYTRAGVAKTVHVTPQPCPKGSVTAGKGCIGFNPIPQYHRVGVGEALSTAVYGMGGLWEQTVGGLLLMVSHPQQYAGSASSIVGIGRAAGVIQDFGPGPYLNLAAVISFSLGIFNLLPFPALDGGRGAFIIVELLRGKPVDPEKEALVHIAGFAVLMVLMIAVTYHDIAKIIAGKSVF